MKKCAVCSKEKANSFFSKKIANKDGLDECCFKCRKVIRTRGRNTRQEMRNLIKNGKFGQKGIKPENKQITFKLSEFLKGMGYSEKIISIAFEDKNFSFSASTKDPKITINFKID